MRGAILFHGPTVGCVKCHRAGDDLNESLGPNLAKLPRDVSDGMLIDSVLHPSKEIRKGYASATVLLTTGNTVTGILVRKSEDEVVLRTVEAGGVERSFSMDDVDDIREASDSIMPKGQVALLKNRQEFLDLLRYLIDLRDGGVPRAKALQPSPAQLALKLPEYEARVDHAGIIADLDTDAMNRGKEVYNSLCINCHGTIEKPGSLPTALRFAQGKFKNGNDPLSMYRTLTHGVGLMLPQPWMVPTQKHDVIHYIREVFVKPHNSEQYFNVTERYLAKLPKGDTRGPAPRKFEPWAKMDYGPYLINTYEVGNGMKNIAQKGIAVQLDRSGGGVGRGRTWAVFDHDTMRLAGGWTGKGFIDWRGIHFNGNHGVHPRVVGDVLVSNLDGPGWADPNTGSFTDDQRVLGRDGRRFGPLPRSWAKYQGLYRYGNQTIISYSVGSTPVLESFSGIEFPDELEQDPLVARIMNIGPRAKPLSMVVATHMAKSPVLTVNGRVATLGSTKNEDVAEPIRWNGQLHGRLDSSGDFEMEDEDFTIVANIKTRRGGSIFSRTTRDSKWEPGGRTFFVRGGHLCFDIGWVGVVESAKKVANGKDNQVAVVWNSDEQRATLYVGGKESGSKVLEGHELPESSAVQVGYTSKNFPSSDNRFDGSLRDLRFFQRALTAKDLKNLDPSNAEGLVAHWPLNEEEGDRFAAENNEEYSLTIVRDESSVTKQTVVAGLSHELEGVTWSVHEQKLCLNLPAGNEPLKFVLWTGRSLLQDREEPRSLLQDREEPRSQAQEQYQVNHVDHGSPRDLDLSAKLHGGPALWPQKVATIAKRGSDNGAFAVDQLTRPSGNPWLARTRLTGLDFYDDGDSMAVCSWDGDVWKVTGVGKLDSASEAKLTWQRIASGLFQPLGLKIVDDRVFVSCRDQIVILNDLNGDGETDFYQCFNDDHQVTEHFHEFAMGLQRDSDGNFYYAKSARHAKTALVPHHGTLLRVSPDGTKTDILAVGFRAANGVCLNPDGSFIVTDQEGHWNPKNRINWVKPGGFYGNIFGYHDVTDTSDEAMDQPLCWITNSFDRSPAELLWVDSDHWGPLNGRLLNLSYGYGKVYVVPHEFIGSQVQGGMCELPIRQLPTGTMRARFSPHDGQMYLCGMFAWGSNQQMQEGGIYRIRYTGKESWMPVGLEARTHRMTLRLSDPVDPEHAVNVDNYRVKVWSLKRSASYGSKHYDERFLPVSDVRVSDDGRTVDLILPSLSPTWCMEIVYRVKRSDGQIVERTIHNTVHAVGD